MKNANRFFIAAAALGLLASTSQLRAGGNSACCSGSCCDNATAASPRVRAVLDERCKSRCAPSAQVTSSTIVLQTEIAASPKAQQMRNEWAQTPAGSAMLDMGDFNASVSDGVAASPKVRAQLDERRQVIEVAPLK